MKRLCCMALVVLSTTPALARIECKQTPVELNITVKEQPVRYDNTLSRAEFLRRARGNADHAIGLTVAEMNIGQQFAYQTDSSIQGACAHVTKIDFEIGYSTLDVYIDKKYKPGSCAYRVVKEHEDYHVEVARQALEFFEPDIRKRLNELKEKLTPVFSYSPQMAEMELQEQMNRLFQRDVMPLVNHINQKMNEKNAEIDTPESYAATNALCHDW